MGENYENQRIEISAFAPPDQFMLLPFQTPKGPIFYDYEALTGKMSVKLYERESKFDPWTLIADLKTENAGIEWGTPDPLEFDKMFLSTMQLQ